MTHDTRLPVLTGAEATGQLYYHAQQQWVEALIPNAPYASCHAADLQELPNGDLLCCWFAGTREGNADVSIVLSRLAAGTAQWAPPVLISDDALRSEQNPSLFLKSPQELWVVYTAQLARTEELAPHCNLQYTAEIRRRTSRDNGATFADTKTVFSRPGSFCRQKIQTLPTGRWLFSTWQCFDDDTRNGSDITLVHRSDDEGLTWSTAEVPQSRGCVHCNLLVRENGVVLALLRSRGADSIYLSRSEDWGETFSEPVATELPNNNSSISALVLQSGAIAVVYNSCSFATQRDVSRWPRQRAPLTIALSDNECRSFDFRRVLDVAQGYCGVKNGKNNSRCEYPVLLQSGDAKLHVAYTWGNRSNIRYLCFDEAWVRGEAAESEGLRYVY